MFLLQRQKQFDSIIETNQTTKPFGLTISEQEAKLILEEKNHTLQEQGRIEFGTGIIPKIIYVFCDSDFVDAENYVDTIIRLQEIFYMYKNEMEDEISDDELLHFMREQFDNICFGDLEYLEGTCLAIFSQAIRAGYTGYQDTEGYGTYSALDEVKRWDYELYLEALKGLF